MEDYDVLLVMALCVAAVAAEVVSQLRGFFAKFVHLVLSVSSLASIATVLLERCSLRCLCPVLRFPRFARSMEEVDGTQETGKGDAGKKEVRDILRRCSIYRLCDAYSCAIAARCRSGLQSCRYRA